MSGGAWLSRVHGVRANASRMSHAELDEATELDDGDPEDLAARYASLRERLPNLNVFGGCCGTDHRHVSEIASAVAGPSAPVATPGNTLFTAALTPGSHRASARPYNRPRS